MPPRRWLPFLAVLLTALALVPAGAHLLALPNKLAMPRAAYQAAQAAYAGWAFLGVLPIGAILACLALALPLWQAPASRPTAARLSSARPASAAPSSAAPSSAAWSALVAALLLAAGLVVFFTWTRPANQATANWTALPEGWEALRAQWEWSHAANALLTLGALCAVLRAALAGGTDR